MPDEYVVLHHPPSGVTHTFTKAREPIKRRDGWVTPDEAATERGPGTVEGRVDRSTVDEVLDWVGGRVGRAQAALAAEQSRPEPRSTLVEALDRVINSEE